MNCMKKISGSLIKSVPVTILCAFLAFCVLVSFFPGADALAGVKIAFNEEEYNIYTEDYPDLVSDNIYSKFTSSVSDPDSYKFSFLSDDALEPFETALKKKNITCKEDCYTAFNILLLQETDDDDKEVYKSATVYMPLPDDAQEYPDYCTFYKVSGGTASVAPSKIYTDEDDINYVQIILSGKSDYSNIYGFVFEDPSEIEAEEDEEEEDEEDEEEDDEDDEDDEEIITKAPTKAVTTPTSAADKSSDDSGKSGSSSSGKKDSSTKDSSKNTRKDNSPKTGDEMDFITLGITGVSALGVLTTSIVLQVKSRKKNKKGTEVEDNDR